MKRRIAAAIALSLSLSGLAGIPVPAGETAAPETYEAAEAGSADAESAAEEFDLPYDRAPFTDETAAEGTYSRFIRLADYKGREILAPADTALETGMTAEIDYTGSIDGELFDGGSGEGYELTIGSGSFIEGFEEQLTGHRAGEQVDVSVTFPKDYYESSLAGKKADFSVRINKIYKNTPYAVLSQITDESEVLRYSKKTYEDWLESYKASFTAYGYKEGDNLNSFLEENGLPREDLDSMIFSSMKVELVTGAILDAEGISMDDDRCRDYISKLLLQYGFDSVEDMKAVGYTDHEIEGTVAYNIALEIIQEYSA